MTQVKKRNDCRTSSDVDKALPHSPTLTSLHLRHNSFSNPSAALSTSELVLQSFRFFTYVIDTSPTSQLILQAFRRFIYVTAHSTTFRCFTYVLGASPTSPGEPHMHRGMKKQGAVDQLLQQFTKFRSSYSFGQLLRILLRAVNFLSYSRAVSSDSNFNIHSALYLVKYPSRSEQNSPEGRMRPAG